MRIRPTTVAIILTFGVAVLSFGIWSAQSGGLKSESPTSGANRATRDLPVANSSALASITQSATRPASTRPVRVAIIGGMFDTGFWQALAERYRDATGVEVRLIAAGPKDQLDKAFKQTGCIDLLIMHSSDTIVNLVADGYAMDPQPWVKNDLVIVGPEDDPAHIHGLTDAAQALKQIADSGSNFVVHSSLGAQEVLVNILERNGIQLDPRNLTILFMDNQRGVLQTAAQKHAYTLVGRIPFLSGKLPNAGLVQMVAGDPRLRRPYLVVVADPRRVKDANVEGARQLVAFLRSPATQTWIGTFGKGRWDDQPLFWPVDGLKP